MFAYSNDDAARAGNNLNAREVVAECSDDTTAQTAEGFIRYIRRLQAMRLARDIAIATRSR